MCQSPSHAPGPLLSFLYLHHAAHHALSSPKQRQRRKTSTWWSCDERRCLGVPVSGVVNLCSARDMRRQSPVHVASSLWSLFLYHNPQNLSLECSLHVTGPQRTLSGGPVTWACVWVFRCLGVATDPAMAVCQSHSHAEVSALVFVSDHYPP